MSDFTALTSHISPAGPTLRQSFDFLFCFLNGPELSQKAVALAKNAHIAYKAEL